MADSVRQASIGSGRSRIGSQAHAKNRMPSTPPNLAKPKEVYVTIRTMATGPYLVANLSRAVIQCVGYAKPASTFWHLPEILDTDEEPFRHVERVTQDFPESPPATAAALRYRLGQRILKTFEQAVDRGDIEQIEASVNSWLSSVRPASEAFVDHARRLDQLGQTDAALDLIFSQVDELLVAGDYQRVDVLLASVPANELSMDLLLGLLAVTLPARSRLTQRATFYSTVEMVLRERGHLKEGLLAGLE